MSFYILVYVVLVLYLSLVSEAVGGTECYAIIVCLHDITAVVYLTPSSGHALYGYNLISQKISLRKNHATGEDRITNI